MTTPQFQCPKCNNTDSIYASAITLYGDFPVSDEGWDFMQSPSHAEIDDTASMRCNVCSYIGTVDEFTPDCHPHTHTGIEITD